MLHRKINDQPDYEDWAKMPTWTGLEAAFLIQGLEPPAVIDYFMRKVGWNENTHKAVKHVSRWIDGEPDVPAALLSDIKLSPRRFIDLASKYNYKTPESLLKAVLKYSGDKPENSSNLNSAPSKQQRSCDHLEWLKAEFFRLDRPTNAIFWKHLKDNHANIDAIDSIEVNTIIWMGGRRTGKDRLKTILSEFRNPKHHA